MIFDSHIHTKFSTDSSMNLKEAVSIANKHSIGLVITDHMDINYPEHMGFRFNPEEFFKEYESMRNDKLLLGIELGLSIDFVPQSKTLVDSYPFDQVIGSIHTIDNEDICFLPYYDNNPYNKVLEKYFTNMKKCIIAHPFIDTLAHIDFIARYAPVKDSEIYYFKNIDYIDDVLKACISTNTAIEVNTRRLNEKSAFENLLCIYKRYKELGGNYVTIGSDAHNPSSIYKHFPLALEIAKECNLTPIYFKERKPMKFH